MKQQNHNQFVRCVEQIQDLTIQKHYDYALLLNGGVWSRKTIKYSAPLYHIKNHIDNSKQILTKTLFLRSLMGQAMKKRSLIALIP
jgi:hypothetical protein